MASSKEALEEIASMTASVNALKSIPVVLPDDFQPDPEDLPRKVSAFPVELPPAPKVDAATTTINAGSQVLTLQIKSSKPAITFSLSKVSPTDTVLSIKEQLAQSERRAPLAAAQRLLYKGKVLADNKLLREYFDSGFPEGDLPLSLMLKPGEKWNAEERALTPAPSAAEPAPSPSASSLSVDTGAGLDRSKGTHARRLSEGRADSYPVPSLVLSRPASPPQTSDPSALSSSPLDDQRRHRRSESIPIDLADPQLELPAAARTRPESPSRRLEGNSYDKVISSSEFWVGLRDFLGTQFGEAKGGASGARDADEAFEMFLLAAKGNLSASDIARVRDAVGVTGMAGT